MKDQSIIDYLLNIKESVDTLVAIGFPLTIDDHVKVILDGLPEDYDSFVTLVLSWLDPYTVEEIEVLLLS